jgi:DNA-binding MltR family transcriptional regulator
MKLKIPQIEKLSEESQSLFDVLNNESDLASVLVGTSYLDYTLASLLARYFIESDIAPKLLDLPRGPLSTFSSRADLAYCLGLIPKGLYQNLETIGRIRNAFAHSYLYLKFDHPEIVKLIDPLIFPTVHQSITIDESGERHDDSSPFSRVAQPRDKFNLIVVMMVNRLLLTGLATQHREKELKGWE